MAVPFSHSCTSFTLLHRHICGRMMEEWCTAYSRGKAESKGMPSCLCCSVWVSIQLWKRCKLLCSRRNSSSLSWMICMWCPNPIELVRYNAVQEFLLAHAGIRVHGGKTHVWNQAGQKPDVCETLQRIAQISDQDAQVWRGSEVPTTMQGMKVLGTPLGHPDHVVWTQ